MSVERTEEGYVIKEEVPQPSRPRFPLLALFFPRLYNLLMLLFGGLFGFSFYGTYRPRTRITEIRRTEEGWQILEYEK